jgi:HlyD family secretion protein
MIEAPITPASPAPMKARFMLSRLRVPRLVPVLLTALALGTPAFAQVPATSVPAAGPSVTVVKATTAEIVQSVVVSGSMTARDEVLVMPEVDGLAIVELLAEEGDRVAAGQILARLSRTTLDVQLAQNRAQIARYASTIEQSQAQIDEAKANLDQANAALERSKALRSTGALSIETYEQRVATQLGSQAKLNSARQALAIASADKVLYEAQGREIEVKLGRTEIKAPTAGLISRRNAKLGTIVALAATDPLFRIIADGAVELQADVAEVELPGLKLGQKVAVTPAGTSTALAGTIRLISPEVDKASRLGKIRIALNGNPPVAIGSFGRGVIETGRKRTVTLPLSAISYGRSGPSVQSVSAGKIATKPVTLGLVGDGRAEIVSGIAEGETVVARAGTFVRDGDVVTPVATN